VEHSGGGISAWKCTLSCTGNATFGNNLAQSYRGGIYAWYNTLNFTGNIDFRSNSPLCGGGIFAKYNTTSLAALLSEQLRKNWWRDCSIMNFSS